MYLIRNHVITGKENASEDWNYIYIDHHVSDDYI